MQLKMDKSVKKGKTFLPSLFSTGTYECVCVCALFYFVLDFLFFSSSWPVTLMLCLSSQAVLLLSFNCKLCSQQV